MSPPSKKFLVSPGIKANSHFARAGIAGAGEQYISRPRRPRPAPAPAYWWLWKIPNQSAFDLARARRARAKCEPALICLPPPHVNICGTKKLTSNLCCSTRTSTCLQLRIFIFVRVISIVRASSYYSLYIYKVEAHWLTIDAVIFANSFCCFLVWLIKVCVLHWAAFSRSSEWTPMSQLWSGELWESKSWIIRL